jgi:hypothetical protein
MDILGPYGPRGAARLKFLYKSPLGRRHSSLFHAHFVKIAPVRESDFW